MDNELSTLLTLKGKPYGGRIEHWVISTYFGSVRCVMHGWLHDKPGREPEKVSNIRTSNIIKLYKAEAIVETENSHYMLGVRCLSAECTDLEAKYNG